ncbi:hypothetical protein AB0C10_16095 [Microbispora amethystogenes]|uniref:hypothetical protein n=1 Tax=Microbispora amethystogenes TaxID=1427754 RepID=UPI0033F8374D
MTGLFFHVVMAIPALRRIAFVYSASPPAPVRTGMHRFVKTGPDGARMVLVLDADDHRAVETITCGDDVKETITPIGPQGLAVWFAFRYAHLLSDGWHRDAVIPPLQVPDCP